MYIDLQEGTNEIDYLEYHGIACVMIKCLQTVYEWPKFSCLGIWPQTTRIDNMSM